MKHIFYILSFLPYLYNLWVTIYCIYIIYMIESRPKQLLFRCFTNLSLLNQLDPKLLLNSEFKEFLIKIFDVLIMFWNKLLSLYCNKRYSIIDRQIARHFVQYSESFSNLSSPYETQIINPFLKSWISAKHDKEYVF